MNALFWREFNSSAAACTGFRSALPSSPNGAACLAKPDETIGFTENMAYDYNLPIGQSDLYRFGDYELRLHADEGGVLRAIQLGK